MIDSNGPSTSCQEVVFRETREPSTSVPRQWKRGHKKYSCVPTSIAAIEMCCSLKTQVPSTKLFVVLKSFMKQGIVSQLHNSNLKCLYTYQRYDI